MPEDIFPRIFIKNSSIQNHSRFHRTSKSLNVTKTNITLKMYLFISYTAYMYVHVCILIIIILGIWWLGNNDVDDVIHFWRKDVMLSVKNSLWILIIYLTDITVSEDLKCYSSVSTIFRCDMAYPEGTICQQVWLV